MGKEILAIPEEKIHEVIYIIRKGLHHTNSFNASVETKDELHKWCDKMEE
jgi:hypothetical protein